VVTSDHAEHATVSSAGAQVMSSQEFIAQCEQDARRPVSKRTPPGKEPKLGDLFPDGL
jgi:predicted RNA-binding protein with PIN domain